MKTADEFRIPIETGKIPLELTVQMKWNIAETISRIHEDGIELGAGDYVDVDDLKYICQAASYLMLYAQQLEAERDAAVADITRACEFCAYYDSAEDTCRYQGCCFPVSGVNTAWKWRGVQKEE